MKAPAWDGDHALTAGYTYSSGTLHAAWDVGCWTGTTMRAPFDGVVVDTRDGIANNQPGYSPGRGAPSNWLTLWEPSKNRTLYYQHLSPGLLVKPGQRVKKGQALAKSGNTGNSSGPHLHLAGMTGKRGAWDRYIYLTHPTTQVYPPSKVWTDLTEEDDPVTRDEMEAIAEMTATRVNGVLGDFTAQGEKREGQEGERGDARLRQIERVVRKIAKKVGA